MLLLVCHLAHNSLYSLVAEFKDSFVTHSCLTNKLGEQLNQLMFRLYNLKLFFKSSLSLFSNLDPKAQIQSALHIISASLTRSVLIFLCFDFLPKYLVFC